VPTT
ncbi:hypothetical protein D018_0465B, partial [Vibrio parahaemolyticus VP2007-007]